MSDQTSHDVYTKLLLRVGHGYPLWIPEPDFDLPVAYRDTGVSVGDLGILTKDGGFSFLFNVCADAGIPDDLVNRGRPRPFGPLRIPQKNAIRKRPNFHSTESPVTSADVSFTRIHAQAAATAGPPAPGTIGGTFEFNTQKTEAAVLELPDGGNRYDTKYEHIFKQYAIDNAHSLYKYVNSPDCLHRGVLNGSLYLVTGCDKARRWRAATVSGSSRTHAASIRFAIGQIVDAGAGLETSRSTPFIAPVTRLYPDRHDSLPEQDNQCIFARGFTITVREQSPNTTTSRSVNVNAIDFSTTPNAPSIGSQIPYSSYHVNTAGSSSSAPGGCVAMIVKTWVSLVNCICCCCQSNKDAQSLSQERTVEPTDSPNRSTELLNPSTKINEPSLSLPHPDRTVAVTRDGDSNKDAQSLSQDRTVESTDSPNRSAELLNPSARINERLLSLHPDRTVAVTHDGDWMKVAKDIPPDEWPDSYVDANDKLASIVLDRSRSNSSSFFLISSLYSRLRYKFDSESGAPQGRQGPVVGDFSTEEGQTTRAVAHGDAPVPRPTSELFTSNITENAFTPSEQHPSSNLTAELGAHDARQMSVGGGTPAQGKHQTFALVIGISEYESVSIVNLKGASKDAENFNRYLLEDLGVAADNIINLRDGCATRSAIIDGFRRLEHDPEIVRDEVAIIIYFAGCGALATKPATWTDWVCTDDIIRLLYPADIGALDANGKVIEGIPDRTINRLLLDLSIAKGNNITLILDCSHAGGINRGASEDSPVQNPETNQSLSPSCDEDIYSREYGTRLYRDKKSGLSNSIWHSHILLAACRRNEYAREEGGQGIFTSALLKSLKQFASRDFIPTYDLLMRHLSMPKQTPYWDGKHIRRRLFDSWQAPADSSMILCYKVGPPLSSTDHLILSAGSLHGITKNSTFEIFRPDSIHSKMTDLLAVSTVTDVQDYVSHLLPTPSHSSLFDSPHNEQLYWYARLRKASGPPILNIYCNDSYVLDSILRDTSEYRITVALDIAENPDNADLCLMVKENIVSFHIGRGLRTKIEFPSQFFPYSPCPVNSLADIQNFINHFAHFMFQLTSGSLSPMKDFAHIKLDKLRIARHGKFDQDSDVVLRKVKNGEFAEAVLSKDCYGFTIHNNSDVDLHVYLLYFDASTLAIDTWHSPQKAQKEGSVDAFLRKNSKITLDYGQHVDGVNPVVITNPDGQDVDVCFFKILVTMEAIDTGPIEQSEFVLSQSPR